MLFTGISGGGWDGKERSFKGPSTAHLTMHPMSIWSTQIRLVSLFLLWGASKGGPRRIGSECDQGALNEISK